ncbi:High cysteine membrane protein Group 4 [Giardia lamblia P15]|uniref:High cysteine membrane protein Group 4 n=1 Tax=Giardia intestinalis (strain P15) TaxID=658858 RepID=E1F8F3_GIAIA|nr:High cysteine membrane protein Group 4 [Giardia lamblia P15]
MYCGACSIEGDVPINGVCVAAGAESSGNTCDKGVCTACTAGYFFHYGSCYKFGESPGSIVCPNQSDTTGSVCGSCGPKFVKNPNASSSATSCLACYGLDGTLFCDECRISVLTGEGAKPTLCTRCKSGHVPIDGRCVSAYSATAALAGCSDVSTRGLCETRSSGYMLFYGSCYLIDGLCIADKGSHTCADGVCTAYDTTTTSIDNSKVFLFYNGCYTQDRSSIGGYICSHASGGMCTECNVGAQGSYVFTNPDISAAERCILCSDTTGFGGYRGVSECHSCAQPVGSGVATALCTKCRSPEQGDDLAPIDHQCQAKGPHDCRAGVCLSCYKTHLLHQSGCYSRHSTTGTAVCAAANQYVLDNVTICGECADASYAPINGACTRVQGGTADAEPHDCTQGRDKGLCTDCAGSAESFLFYGGCYGKGSGTGAKLCSAVASGVCTEWRTQFDFIFSKDGKSGGYLCGDAENGGISGCATCSYGDGALTCTRCSSGYLGVDGRSCSEGCGDGAQGVCAGTAGGSEPAGGACRCVCKPGLYNSSGACTSCADSCAVCKEGVPDGCQRCKPGKVLEPSVVARETARCVDECTAGGECAECAIAIDGSRYCTRCRDPSMYPLNGVCLAGAREDPYCTSRGDGVCTACAEGAFLMSGGCYRTGVYPGSVICSVQSGGRCKETKKGYGMSDDGELLQCDPTCLECKAPGPGRCTRCPPGRLLRRAPAAATGSCIEPGACADGYYADGDACLPCVVPGCRACGHTSFCTECAGELFVGLDGRACLRECSGDRVVGEASGGTRRCWCERGFVPAPDRSGCVPVTGCSPDMPWCASCDESGRCLSCAAPGHNIQVDQRTCAEGCGDRAAPDQGVCVCETGTVLDKDACVPINALTGRKMMVVTTSAAAAVLVISVLVGFLCWWFICRGKRRCYR